MNGLDIRFVILTVDSIIVLGLMMTLIIRLINRTLTTTNEPTSPSNGNGPKTIDQMNIDIPL
jgi:hypothetical protein